MLKSNMFLLLLSVLTLDKSDVAIRTQARCEAGCVAQGYDSGVYSPKKSKCLCIDAYDLSDLYLKKFYLPILPKSY